MKTSAVVLLAGFALGFAYRGVGAHEGEGAPRAGKPAIPAPEDKSFGRAGDARRAQRTVRIDMSDSMRFTPAQITVKRGDTVRFVVSNSGRQLHELVLGSMRELNEHAALMKKFPGMEHAEPYMVHVRPGARGEFVWQFTVAGEFHYGCLIPGHFESGMVGQVRVTQ